MVPRLWRVITLAVFVAALVVAGGCANKATAPRAPETSKAPEAGKSLEWPTQDITVIVPLKPGGGVDILARTTTPFIEKYLPKHVNVIVKNVPGASGKIGLMELFKAKPDGHTVAVLNGLDFAVMQVAGQLEGMDVRRLSWIGQLDRAPYMLGVGAHSGLKKPSDMKGKTVRFAGINPTMVFSEAVIARAVGATPQFVMYDGSGEAAMAVMRGDSDAFVLGFTSLMRNAKASEGKLIPMFIVSQVPDVPELKGIPSARDLGIELEDEELLAEARALVGPPGLPSEVRSIWEEIITKVYNDPDWVIQLKKANYNPAPLTGDKLQSYMAATVEKVETKYKDIVNTFIK